MSVHRRFRAPPAAAARTSLHPRCPPLVRRSYAAGYAAGWDRGRARPGPAAYGDGAQVTVKLEPVTVIVLASSGLLARLSGVGDPVVMSKWLAWHGQMISPPSTCPTMQPWWVHTAEKALN